MAKKESTTPAADMTDKKIDQLFSAVESEGALISCEDMDRLERYWEDDRATRRCSLIMLTKPFKELQSLVESDRGFALAMAATYDTLDTFAYESLSQTITKAHANMMLLLACREDMEALLAEARSQRLSA